MKRWLLVLLPTLFISFVGACSRPPSPPAPPAGAAPAPPAGAAPAPPVAPGATTLTGTLRHKPWSKTEESYRAGGSDYVILETTDGARVLLVPSDQVSAADLAQLDGRRVEVQGAHFAGRVVTNNPFEQHIMVGGPDGKMHVPPTRRVGEGFQVRTIRPLPAQ